MRNDSQAGVHTEAYKIQSPKILLEVLSIKKIKLNLNKI